MPLTKPMNAGIKNGRLVIDMAEADALWKGLTQEQQYEAMCIMFEPIMDTATKMKRALIDVVEAAERQGAGVCYEIAREALE